MDLSDRTILVTGASSGIGRETAILLSQLGARVVLVARSMERLEQTVEKLDGSYHRIELFDLTAVDEIPAWLKRVTAETGPLHGLVHSAGIQYSLAVRSLNSQHIENLVLVNLSAAILLTKAMRQKGCHGSESSIVFLSSTAALIGEIGLSAYAATKGALISLTKSLAKELARDGIRINCVAPAAVDTEMLNDYKQRLTPEQFIAIEALHPLGIGTPRYVAYAISFLLAETGRWITGTTLTVDGGYTASPDFLET